MSVLPPLPLTYLHLPCQQPELREPLFLLHGYGSNEEDLFSFAEDLSSRYEIFSLRAPLHLDPFGFAWYQIDFEAPKGKWSDLDQARESLALITAFIEQARLTFGPFNHKSNLLGFSQGAILSLALGLNQPANFQRVVGLSGYLNTELLTSQPDRSSMEGLQIYCSHGLVDPVIPVEWARNTPDYLQSLGKSITYEEFESGHGVNPANYQSFTNWMLG